MVSNTKPIKLSDSQTLNFQKIFPESDRKEDFCGSVLSGQKFEVATSLKDKIIHYLSNCKSTVVTMLVSFIISKFFTSRALYKCLGYTIAAVYMALFIRHITRGIATFAYCPATFVTDNDTEDLYQRIDRTFTYNEIIRNEKLKINEVVFKKFKTKHHSIAVTKSGNKKWAVLFCDRNETAGRILRVKMGKGKIYEEFTERGYNILAINHPGASKGNGIPVPEQVVDLAFASIQFVKKFKSKHTILAGKSFGVTGMLSGVLKAIKKSVITKQDEGKIDIISSLACKNLSTDIASFSNSLLPTKYNLFNKLFIGELDSVEATKRINEIGIKHWITQNIDHVIWKDDDIIKLQGDDNKRITWIKAASDGVITKAASLLNAVKPLLLKNVTIVGRKNIVNKEGGEFVLMSEIFNSISKRSID